MFQAIFPLFPPFSQHFPGSLGTPGGTVDQGTCSPAAPVATGPARALLCAAAVGQSSGNGSQSFVRPGDLGRPEVMGRPWSELYPRRYPRRSMVLEYLLTCTPKITKSTENIPYMAHLGYGNKMEKLWKNWIVREDHGGYLSRHGWGWGPGPNMGKIRK